MNVVVYYEKLIAPKGSGGGGERLAIEEAKFLDATLLTFEADPEVIAYAGTGGVEGLWVLGREALKEGLVERANLRSFLLVPTRVIMLIAALRRLRPDIIITSWKGGWLTMYLATRLVRAPYILHYHKTTFWFNKGAESLIKYSLIHRSQFETISRTHVEPIDRQPPPGPARLALEILSVLDYLAVKKAAAVLVNSKAIAREMKVLYGIDTIVLPITAVRAVPARSDIRRELGIDGKVILSVSRLEPEKRVDILVRALALIRETRKDVFLVVVGTGTQLEELRNLATELGAEGAVRFEGFVPEERLNDYYHACDLFAFAGRSDFVLTVYEAMAAGKKVVCSSEMDLADEVKSSGLATRAHPDAQAFAEAATKALSTDTVPSARVELSTWDSYLEKVRKICGTILAAQRSRSGFLQ